MTPAEPAPAPHSAAVRGVCSVFFAYDLGQAIDLDAAERRLDSPTHRETFRHRRRAPKHFEFRPAPLRITRTGAPIAVLPDGAETRAFATKPSVECVLYDFGAVSINYEIPIGDGDSLRPFHDLLALSDELYDSPALLADSAAHARAILAALGTAISDAALSPLVEDYAVYHLCAVALPGSPDPAPSPWSPDHHLWLDQNAHLAARILRSEPGRLSEQEVADAVTSRLSYGPADCAIIDWNASLIFMHEAEDLLAVLEFVNTELLEMRFLDDRLDEALDRGYDALVRRGPRFFGFASGDTESFRVARLQADSAMLFEGVNNALKLVGDQYLARFYRRAAERLHLPEWDRNILRKLDAADSIYQKISDRQSNRRMEALEWIIILLIAFEVVKSLVP